jgi:hypothetical protein
MDDAVIIKRTEVNLDGECVVISLACATSYEAVVLYEHIVDCLDKRVPFSVRIGDEATDGVRH